MGKASEKIWENLNKEVNKEKSECVRKKYSQCPRNSLAEGWIDVGSLEQQIHLFKNSYFF